MKIQDPMSIEEALLLRDRGALFVDARSPAEFAKATIPGAINVPILNDAERAEIGTMYKQQGRDVARQRGISLVSFKIPAMVEAVREAIGSKKRPVLVFCWRGGLRSQALANFLCLDDIPARQIVGGHKAFRKVVRDFFEQGEWGSILVLRGLTGVGKTRLLHRLAAEDWPVLDLEGLANHRGSAFGALGLAKQPGQMMFEALVWDHLRQISPGEYVITEGESKMIGRLCIPPRLYAAMQEETSIWINAPLERRIEIILDDYPAREQHKDLFVRPLQALKERLGKERVAEMLDLLEKSEWEELTARLMIDYYDPQYNHLKPDDRVELEVSDDEAGVVAVQAACREILGEEQSPA